MEVTDVHVTVSIDAALDSLVAQLAEHGGPKRVQLDRWFEPDVIAYSVELPDRFIAGRAVFDGLRARGYAEVT
jgi:hypothetical protein